MSQGERICGIIPRYRERIRGMTPIAVQRYLFASCTGQTSYNTRVLPDCDPAVSGSEARAILDRYRSAPGLVDDLRYRVSKLEPECRSAVAAGSDRPA